MILASLALAHYINVAPIKNFTASPPATHEEEEDPLSGGTVHIIPLDGICHNGEDNKFTCLSPPHNFSVDLGQFIGQDSTQYSQLSYFLSKLTEQDTVTFNLHNYGGSVFTGMIVMSAIHNTKARTIAHIDSFTASMGALIACSAQTITMDPLSFLMFHNGSVELGGKTSDVESELTALHKNSIATLDICVDHKILTKEQEQQILEGKDIYIFPKDLKR